jgi:hypothetical protein
MQTRVTLRPGQRGTKKLVQRFGARLICVRYRYDGIECRRLTTVELIVDEAPWRPANPWAPRHTSGDRGEFISVRVDYHEVELRERVKSAGARWDPQKRVWILPLAQARRLGLQNRIAPPDGTARPRPLETCL